MTDRADSLVRSATRQSAVSFPFLHPVFAKQTRGLAQAPERLRVSGGKRRHRSLTTTSAMSAVKTPSAMGGSVLPRVILRSVRLQAALKAPQVFSRTNLQSRRGWACSQWPQSASGRRDPPPAPVSATDARRSLQRAPGFGRAWLRKLTRRSTLTLTLSRAAHLQSNAAASPVKRRQRQCAWRN